MFASIECLLFFFLIIFSSPTCDWCDSDGQQRANSLQCWRQTELNWKPWQHSACLFNPLALPQSRQIPAQGTAYSAPACKDAQYEEKNEREKKKTYSAGLCFTKYIFSFFIFIDRGDGWGMMEQDFLINLCQMAI